MKSNVRYYFDSEMFDGIFGRRLSIENEDVQAPTESILGVVNDAKTMLENELMETARHLKRLLGC